MDARAGSTTTHSSRPALILVFLIWAAAAGVMFFATGSGEHDTFMMAAGVAYAEQTGQTFNALNYGTNLQFTFYLVYSVIAPLGNLDAAGVLRSMNVAGIVLALVIPFLFHRLLARNLGAARADLGTLLFMVTPAWLFTVPYGHPFHLAMALALAAFLLFHDAVIGRDKGTGRGKLAAALALHVLALTVRAEQVGLFWAVLTGLLLYRRERRTGVWVLWFGFLGVSAALFLAARMLVVPPVASPESKGAVQGLVGLLGYSLPRMELLIPSIAHHLVGVGIPALGVSAVAFVMFMVRRRWPEVLVVLAAAMPPLLIYLNNPSPPRHVVSLGIAVAVFLAIAAGPRRPRVILGLALATFAANMLIPPAIAGLESALGVGDRRNYTYNVFQRQGRNHEQVSASLPLFSTVLDRAPDGTVVIANWIHIAESTMLAVDRLDTRVEPVRPLPGVRAIRVESGGRTLLFIEEYDPETARVLIERLREQDPARSFLTLLREGEDLNELGIPIPSKVYWWNA